MQPSNGPQGQFGFAGEQGNNMYPATPVQNNHSTAMRQPITYGNAQPQQGRPRGQPQFIGQQQVVNFNGAPHTLPVRNNPIATMNFSQGNTQLAQQIPRSQPRLVNQQMINAGAWAPEVVVLGNNPYTMDTPTDFYTLIGQQPGQFQNIRNSQHAQVFQDPEEYEHGQNYQYGQNYHHGQNQQNSQTYQRVQRYHNSPVSNNHQNNQRGVPNPAASSHQPGAGRPPQAGQNAMALQAAITAQRAAAIASRAATNAPRAATAPHSTTDAQQAIINAPRAASAPRAAAALQATTDAPRLAASPQPAVPPQAATPAQAGSSTASAPEVRPAELQESSMGTEVTEELQDEVNLLIKEKATTFKGHIKSPKDVALYKQAVWKARLRGGSNHEKKCADYPKDEAGEMEIIGRIFNAIVNVGGEQDPASESGDLANCLAVKTIRGLTGIEVEFLAHDFLEDMRKIQSGEPVLPPESKVVQEDTFAAKVDKVVAALSVNKPLCRSATTGRNWVSRIAADPAGERNQKVVNVNGNIKKNLILAAESLKKGTARKGKGKGKRAAAAEPEAEPQPEAPAEVSDTVRATQAAA